MRNKRILILDDDGDYRKLLSTHLGSVFKNIDLVEYDPVAMGIPGSNFQWSDYDVLILDYDLRNDKANGLDILRENREDPDFPATIMLTGAGSEEVAVTALKSGVRDYFRKDTLNKEQLQDAVRNIFTSQQLHKERTYTMEEAQKAAKAEAMKMVFAFRTRYDRLHNTEMEKLRAEKTRLERELKESKKNFEQLTRMIRTGGQERTVPSRQAQESAPGRANIRIPSDDSLQKKQWVLEPVENAKLKQERVEADLRRVNWKIQQADDANKQFTEDIALFRRESRKAQAETSQKAAEQEKHAHTLAVESARKKLLEKKDDRNLMDDVASQLKKD